MWSQAAEQAAGRGDQREQLPAVVNWIDHSQVDISGGG